MTPKVYVGDTGTVITLDCGQDITSATARSIEVRKPGGATTTWAAVASGTNAISFTTAADSLDIPGAWKLQALVVMPSGSWRGTTAVLTVTERFA